VNSQKTAAFDSIQPLLLPSPGPRQKFTLPRRLAEEKSTLCSNAHKKTPEETNL
jgi:hypothetical protein